MILLKDIRVKPKVRSEVSMYFTQETSFADVANELFMQKNDSYNSMVYENMRIAYITGKTQNFSICTEGLKEIKMGIIKWFKDLIDNIKTLIDKAINYVSSYTSSMDTIIKRYQDNRSSFQGFDASGFNYTINNTPVDTSVADKQIAKYNSIITKLHSMSKEEYNELLLDVEDEDGLDLIRGAVIGSSSACQEGEFIDTAKASFRDNSRDKLTIVCNSNTIDDMCENFTKIKPLLESVKKDKAKLEQFMNNVQTFIKSQPNMRYEKYEKKVSVSTIKDADGNQETVEHDYTETYAARIAGFTNKFSNLVKKIAHIYTTYINLKIDAIRDALSFYESCIRKATRNDGKSKSDKTVEESLTIDPILLGGDF